MSGRLIVNVDDLGATRGVQRALEACLRSGTVTSATLMANGPYFEEAVRFAHANPRLGVGVHLNLVQWSPILPPEGLPGLVDGEGRFLSRSALLRQALRGRLKAGQVKAELRAQVERCLSAGIRVTHVDSHQHCGLLPGVFPSMLEIAREFELPVRIPREPLLVEDNTWRHFGAAYLRKVILGPRAARCKRKAETARVRTPDVFLSFSAVFPRRCDLPTVKRLLAQAPGRVAELGVHPA
ncbi:MAG: carbohydrate deacetylase, partial [Nitrospinota bacterium]